MPHTRTASQMRRACAQTAPVAAVAAACPPRPPHRRYHHLSAAVLCLSSTLRAAAAGAFVASPPCASINRRPVFSSSSSSPLRRSMSMSEGLADIGSGGATGAAPPTAAARAKDDGAAKPDWMVRINRSLARGGKDPTTRYIQLATVGEEEGEGGSAVIRPFVRTVVFRGFLAAALRPKKEEEEEEEKEAGAAASSHHYLKMITDARSEKIGHLAKFPHAEVAWYFPKTREQFRVFGSVRVVSAADGDRLLQSQRKHQWSCLSDNARVQFLWPHPKQPLPDRESKPQAELQAMFSPPAPSAGSDPPESFCLVLLRPLRVDHLELKPNPQRRTVSEWKETEQEWVDTPVNP